MIIKIVNPQKLVFLALDGVAPRAKANQQRSRRFISAKSYKELNEALKVCGICSEGENFKNNSITPGTEFMYELNNALKFFIKKKIEEDEDWRGLKFVFSGSDVPGEGEHKILDYIRQMKKDNLEETNKLTHCIYGADSDLIMLGLVSHLPNFVIVREIDTFRPKISKAAKRTASIYL